MEGLGNDESRPRTCSQRQSGRGGSRHLLRYECITINWRGYLLSVSCQIWPGPMPSLGQFDDAWRYIDEAYDGGRNHQGKVVRGRSESRSRRNCLRCRASRTRRRRKPISSGHLAIARQQQAKSWELRAAMSMARLWRDQGKPAASPRTSRSGLRLVHRRLRYTRSKGGEEHYSTS